MVKYINEDSRKSRFLARIAHHHKTNHIDEERLEYPQLWWVVSKYPQPIKKVIQFLCGLLGGHELSKTEWGYGGEHVDRWCRWCNKFIQVPKTSIYFTHPHSRQMIKDLDEGKLFGEDLPHD